MTDNINPKHYRNGDIECIEAIRAALTPEEFRGYCKGNAIKYVWREGMKGGNESLQKANWYMDKAVSVSSQPQPAKPARAEELQADEQGPACSCPGVMYQFLQDKEVRHICAEKPIDDGWIEWGGGECPIQSGISVLMKWSDGSIDETQCAPGYRWAHETELRINLIAYRLAKEQA